MSVGAVLTEIFDVIWLLSILGLGATTAWLVYQMLRDIREIKATLKATTGESSRAIVLLADAISDMETLLAAKFPPATPPATAPVKPTATSQAAMKPATKPKTSARQSSPTRQAARQ